MWRHGSRTFAQAGCPDTSAVCQSRDPDPLASAENPRESAYRPRAWFALACVLTACAAPIEPKRSSVAPLPATEQHASLGSIASHRAREPTGEADAGSNPAALTAEPQSTDEPGTTQETVTSGANQPNAQTAPQHQTLREREYVDLDGHHIRCGHTNRSRRGKRCLPVESAIAPFMSRPGQLEYVNDLYGMRHAAVYFTQHATDCDVEEALCAVGGDLVSFGPPRVGVVLFPWVHGNDDLNEAIGLMKKQSGVDDVTFGRLAHLE